jgi:hypothetical protein
MSRKKSEALPEARTERLIVEEVGAEAVVFDEDSAQAHSLSPLAAAVFAGSDGGRSVTELAEFAGARLGESVDVEQVQDALVQLDELGLMAVAPKVISRRALLRKTAAGAAVGAAFSAPLISSVLTPAYAQVSPGAACPGAICASQSQGDDYCACANACPGCPGFGASDCKCPDDGGLWVDSCECLNCSELTARGRADLCPPTPYQQCPPGSSQQTPGPGGCQSPDAFLDGRCFKIAGDSSEPCPTPD